MSTRQRYLDDAVLVGFTTYHGTVSAASDWGHPVERKQVRPAMPESYEALLHEVGVGDFLLDLGDLQEVTGNLHELRSERAIGVIYRPDSERESHDFTVDLPEQFDVVLHYDETRAVEPLERTGLWEAGEPPEAYPSAL